ncbi:MAG: LysR substrate-binding domain-containing protein [Parvibaculaceae bacterium]
MQIPRRLLPPIHALHAFEAAARTGSISNAARELDLTQSAVSRQIKALEDQLGLELFVRDKQTIRLTLAGQSYARDIREALRRVSTASLNIRANPLGGSLTLGILPTFGTRWLAGRLPGFAAQFPDIRLNLFSRSTPFDFNLDSIDAAIHFGKAEWPDVTFTPLFGETVLPVGAPELVRRFSFASPKDIRQAPLLILLSRPDAWERWLSRQGDRDDGIRGMMFDHFEMVIRAARCGLGLALLPTFLIEEEIARGELVPVLEPAQASAERYYLVNPSERDNYAPLVAFRAWLIGEVSPSGVGV